MGGLFSAHQELLKKHTSFTLTYYAILFGVILLLPLTLSEGFVQQIQTMSPSVILAILYMGIFASGFGYLFYNLSIKEIGATKTASFVYSLVPVFVAVLALLFFNESITGMMGLSAGLIVFGLHFMLHKRK
ncbi:DMT family transporter [candidate division KSB1 bacterium]|nr:DMT family transporter [candidate division KSB1 bacterium]